MAIRRLSRFCKGPGDALPSKSDLCGTALAEEDEARNHCQGGEYVAIGSICSFSEVFFFLFPRRMRKCTASQILLLLG